MSNVQKKLGVAVVLASLGLTSAVSASTLNLSWTNNSTLQTSVSIERCLGVGCSTFAPIGTVAGTVATFVDATVSGELVTACYRVRGLTVTDSSGYSNTACAKTKLNDPTNLIVQ